MAALIMNNKDLLYVIKPEEQNESTLRELLPRASGIAL